MSNIFEVVDPRGFTVICEEDVWRGHILDNRPFMNGWEEEVASAIKKPTFGVYQDANRPERHIYYQRNAGNPRYMKVVVEFQEEKLGKVITAFPTDSMKRGEKLIYP